MQFCKAQYQQIGQLKNATLCKIKKKYYHLKMWLFRVPFSLLISVTTIRSIKSYIFSTLITTSQTPIRFLQRSISWVQNGIFNAKWVITQTSQFNLFRFNINLTTKNVE